MDADAKERRGRQIASILLDDGGDTWTPEEIYRFLESDGWRWDGDHWVEVSREQG